MNSPDQSKINPLDSILVTVAMPTFNGGQFLEYAVKTILNQTHTNWELLIIDDGSTDNSLNSIVDIQDKRVKVYKDGLNKGLAIRLNEAIDLAQGKYFARMDQDDMSFPDRLHKQIEKLENDKSIDLLSVRALTIDESNGLVGYMPYEYTHSEITSKPWRSIHMPHPTWMGKIDWFRKNRYSELKPYFCEDQELLIRTYEGSAFLCLPEILFAYRLRKKTSFNKLRKIRWAILKLQLKKFLSTYSFIFILYSTINFLLNYINDALNTLIGIPYHPYRKTYVKEIHSKEYVNILNSLATMEN